MKIISKTIKTPTNTSCDCLTVFISPTRKQSQPIQALDKQLGGLVTRAIHSEELGQGIGKTLLLHTPEQAFKRLLLISCGTKLPLTSGQWQSVAHHLSTQLKNPCFNKLIFMLDPAVFETQNLSPVSIISSVITQANYHYLASFGKKSSPPKQQHFSHIKEIVFATDNAKQTTALKSQIESGISIGNGVNAARELGNLPGNYCTPSFLASEARALAKKHAKISCTVLNEKRMRELKMDSLLSVSAGSEQPAKLIQLEYKGATSKQPPIILVGKGITFDSGGISLKPGAAMDEMKFDMCGAASVMGVFHALASMDLALNIVGIIAASENMPNGKATKPGDVITSMSGKTIEVLNTDAEGRLVLCDALTYAQRFYKPALIIDIATLTGACVIALGSHASGLYSNNDALAEALIAAGEKAHDRAWRMPMWEDYNKQLKSNFADLANIGGREAGSVTAACFLSNFVEENTVWAHLDIAGVAWKKGAAKGATGKPVCMLLEFLRDKAKHK